MVQHKDEGWKVGWLVDRKRILSLESEPGFKVLEFRWWCDAECVGRPQISVVTSRFHGRYKGCSAPGPWLDGRLEPGIALSPHSVS